MTRSRLWRVITFAMVAAAGLAAWASFTFVVAKAVKQVPQNTDSIRANCEARNEQLRRVNERFRQLVELFDESVRTRPSTLPPLSPRVMELLDEFRPPIELSDCRRIVH